MFSISMQLVLKLLEVATRGFSCETVEDVAWDHGKCCIMNSTTTISKANVALVAFEDLNMKELRFDLNQKIEFLPVDLHKNFPNMQKLSAVNCSIREIFAGNFERLQELQFVDLRANHIRSIPNYCFDDLPNLEYIFLGT